MRTGGKELAIELEESGYRDFAEKPGGRLIMPARIVSSRTDAEVALADAYGLPSKNKLPGAEAIRHLRDAAFGTFAAAGLPHRRIEAWHYTDLRTLMREALPVAPKPDSRALGPINQDLAGRPMLGGGRLVIVDGTFVPSLSDALPDGASVRSLADVLSEGRPRDDRPARGQAISARGMPFSRSTPR